MSGKPTKGGKRIQVLHDLINDDGYVALKWTAEDGEVWRYRGRIYDSGRLLILMMLCIIIVTVSSVTFMNFTAISFSCLLMLSWTVATRRTWQCVTVPFRLSLPLQMEIFHLCETAVKSVGYHAIFGCCKSDCMSVHTYSRQNLTLVTLSVCGKPSLKRSVCVCGCDPFRMVFAQRLIVFQLVQHHQVHSCSVILHHSSTKAEAESLEAIRAEHLASSSHTQLICLMWLLFLPRQLTFV